MRPTILPLLLLPACGDASGPAAPTGPGAAPAGVAPLDGRYARRTPGPRGGVEALVSEAGELRIRPLGSTEPGRWLDAAVDPRLAFSPDGELIVYAREDTLRETDLWVVPVAGGAPERLTHWRGTEDRPVVSPDGRSVAFVAGYTGIASWWVVDLAGPRPVPVEAGRQLTNLGLERVAHLPGQAPAGWRPVPDGTEYGWGDAGIEWVSGGARHALQVGSR